MTERNGGAGTGAAAATPGPGTPAAQDSDGASDGAVAGLKAARVTAFRDGRILERGDLLADEVPIALVFNGIAQVVMLATPADLEDFALGFGLTEGLLEARDELLGVDVVETHEGIELELEVVAACEMRLKGRRRALAGRTGCGLCGAESLGQIRRALAPAPVVTGDIAALARCQQQMPAHQQLQQRSGATHAAAWCALDGTVRLVREDVGRHNALDKLVGAMTRAGLDPVDGFAWISSRASYEMVQKASVAGMGLLAATSAPTARAVALAGECGLALAGFVRADRLVAYTFAERFRVAGPGRLSDA